MNRSWMLWSFLLMVVALAGLGSGVPVLAATAADCTSIRRDACLALDPTVTSPSQTVNIKGWGFQKLPSDPDCTVTLTSLLTGAPVSLSPPSCQQVGGGAIDASFVVPDDIAEGDYIVTITSADNEFSSTAQITVRPVLVNPGQTDPTDPSETTATTDRTDPSETTATTDRTDPSETTATTDRTDPSETTATTDRTDPSETTATPDPGPEETSAAWVPPDPGPVDLRPVLVALVVGVITALGFRARWRSRRRSRARGRGLQLVFHPDPAAEVRLRDRRRWGRSRR